MKSPPSFNVVSKLESNIELLSRVRGGVRRREAWVRGDDRVGIVGGTDMVDDPYQSTGDAEFVSIAELFLLSLLLLRPQAGDKLMPFLT